jgi:hypothetical protein
MGPDVYYIETGLRSTILSYYKEADLTEGSNSDIKLSNRIKQN